MRLLRRNFVYLLKISLFGAIITSLAHILLYNDGIRIMKTSMLREHNAFGLPTNSVASRPTLAPSRGEELAHRVLTKCKGRQLLKSSYKFPVTTNKDHKLLYCPICKLGSTYWTRFFRFLDRYETENMKSPYDIPIADAPPTAERIQFIKGKETERFRDYYRYMFVRDPYSRIVSAFVDKLFAPNPEFWGLVSRKIIEKYRGKGSSKFKCGADLKFKEYVRAIIDAHKVPSKSVDCHDATFISYCHVCETKFDFIGKMETFISDSTFIYRKVKLHQTIDFLIDHGKSISGDDALIETVTGPFESKKAIKKCISWKEALKRTWRKLQIRGIIGKEEFPLDENQSENISRDEFIKLIKETGKRTPYSKRKLQRKEALIEMFSEISKSDLEAISRVYSEDFDLFEYDPKPSYLFNASTPVEKYGYESLNTIVKPLTRKRDVGKIR